MTDIGPSRHKLQFIPPQLRASARVVCDVDVKYFPELQPETSEIAKEDNENEYEEYKNENQYRYNSSDEGDGHQWLLREGRRARCGHNTYKTNNTRLHWRSAAQSHRSCASLEAIRQLATEINDNVPLTDKEFTLFRLAYAECQRHLRGVQVSLLTSSTPIGNVLMMTTQLDVLCSEHNFVLSHFFPKMVEYHNYFLAMHEEHVTGAQGVYFELLMEHLCTLLSRAAEFVVLYKSFLEAVEQIERQQQTLFHNYDKEDDVYSFRDTNNSDNDEVETNAYTLEYPSAFSCNNSSTTTSMFGNETHNKAHTLPSVIDLTALQEKRALTRRIRERNRLHTAKMKTEPQANKQYVEEEQEEEHLPHMTQKKEEEKNCNSANKTFTTYTASNKLEKNCNSNNSYNNNNKNDNLETNGEMEYAASLNAMPLNWASVLSRINSQIALHVCQIDWLVCTLTECGMSFNAEDYIDDRVMQVLWVKYIGVNKPACTWEEFVPIWQTLPQWCQPAVMCILLYGYERRDVAQSIVVSLYSVDRLLRVLGPMEHLERNLYECAINSVFSFSLLYDEVQYLFARRSDAKAGDYLATLTTTPGEVRLVILLEARSSAFAEEHSTSMCRLNAPYVQELSRQLHRTSLNELACTLNSYVNVHPCMNTKTNDINNVSNNVGDDDDSRNNDIEHEHSNLSYELSVPHTEHDRSGHKRSSSNVSDLFAWFVFSFLQFVLPCETCSSSPIFNLSSSSASRATLMSQENKNNNNSNSETKPTFTLMSYFKKNSDVSKEISTKQQSQLPLISFTNANKANNNIRDQTNEQGLNCNIDHKSKTRSLFCVEQRQLSSWKETLEKEQQEAMQHDSFTRKRSYEERVFSSIDEELPCTFAPLLTVSNRLLHDSGAWAINGVTREEYESIPQICKAFEEFMLRACGDDLNLDLLLADNLEVVERLEKSLRCRSWYVNGTESSNNNNNNNNNNNINSRNNNNRRGLQSTLRVGNGKSNSIFSEQYHRQQSMEVNEEVKRVHELASSSSLHAACFRGNIRYVRSLLQRGNAALINTPMRDSHVLTDTMWTPLHCAVNNSPQTDPVDTICLLLQAGANVLWVDDAQCDALYYAIANGYAESVKVLLKAGARRDNRNNNVNNKINNINKNNRLVTIMSDEQRIFNAMTNTNNNSTIMQTPAVLLALGAHHAHLRDVDVIRFAHVLPSKEMLAAIAPSIHDYELIALAIRIMEDKMRGVDYTCTPEDVLLVQQMSMNELEMRNSDESVNNKQTSQLRTVEEEQHLNRIISHHTAWCVDHVREMHTAIIPLYNRAYYLSWQKWLTHLNLSHSKQLEKS